MARMLKHFINIVAGLGILGLVIGLSKVPTFLLCGSVLIGSALIAAAIISRKQE
jgi:hypothetical protein